jgi:hypothetical protein
LTRLSKADDGVTEILPKAREVLAHFFSFVADVMQFDVVDDCGGTRRTEILRVQNELIPLLFYLKKYSLRKIMGSSLIIKHDD